MSSDRSDVIARLSARIAAGDKNPQFRRAAAATGGLPIFFLNPRMILLVTLDGDVVALELGHDVPTRETDERRRLLALAIAARSYPELGDLVPPRPSTAATCITCEGTGMFHGSYCWDCEHLGWIDGLPMDEKTAVDDLVALSPRGTALRWSVLANIRGRSPQAVLRTGTDVVEDRTAVLCAHYVHGRSPTSVSVRTLVQNDLFTAVIIWLDILGRQFQEARSGEDFDGAVRLLIDLWRTIAARPDERIVTVIPLTTAAFVVSTALRAAHEGSPLFGRLDPDIPGDGRVLAALSRCQGLGEVVREARSLITT